MYVFGETGSYYVVLGLTDLDGSASWVGLEAYVYSQPQ